MALKREHKFVIVWTAIGVVAGVVLAASQLKPATDAAGETAHNLGVLLGGAIAGGLIGALIAAMRGYFGR